MLSVLLLIAAGALQMRTADAAGGDDGALLAATNQSRAEQGLGGLGSDGQAAGVAAAWAQQMASGVGLAHNPALQGQVASAWTALGENVGRAGSAGQMESLFMASPVHRANILGNYNRVGVGTARDGSGVLWASVVFLLVPGASTGPARSAAAPAQTAPGQTAPAPARRRTVTPTVPAAPEPTPEPPPPPPPPTMPAAPDRVAALLQELRAVAPEAEPNRLVRGAKF